MLYFYAVLVRVNLKIHGYNNYVLALEMLLNDIQVAISLEDCNVAVFFERIFIFGRTIP